MIDAAASVLSGSLAGTELAADELRFLSKESPAGLTLFGRNIDQSSQSKLLELTKEIQSQRRMGTPPMIISIDQEGGRVSRLKAPFINKGAALELAEGKSDQNATEEIWDYGKELANKLLEMGINCNFAPVVDILTEPENEAIGDRCFSTDSGAVVLRAGSMLAGMKSTGLLTCLKHFPGQGHANIDTHKGTAVVDVAENLLMKREMFPFVSLHKVAPMIMVSHCIYSNLDDQVASMSQVIMTDLLRKQVGFQGVIVTDDMTMGAIPSEPGEWKKSIIASITAGADLVLICQGLDRWQMALDALRSEASKSSWFDQRLNDAASRVIRMRQTIQE